MQCPYCGKDQDKVVDTRSRNNGRVIRRRRLCIHCGRRFVTIEEIEDKTLAVIKSDNRREPFDRRKLLHGIQIACSKRPVSIDQIEKLVERIESDIENEFVREIESRRIGEMVIRHLRALDEVAYVRFASVYRNFKDKEEFMRELNQLESE
ncbi:MAG TPA: transcriptional repressor NrdR [bacterium]|nr:transcriptional repressor NrdR [bacterium]